MVNLAIAFPFVLLALAAVAIYVQVTSSNLSFPISTGTTALTIILPFIAFANILYTPQLRRLFQQRVTSSSTLLQFLPVASPVLQAILTVVLATLTAEGFSSGQGIECSLERSWQRLWSAHDYRAIERIQDTFNCCGLRSLPDRNAPRGMCQELHRDRGSSCLVPWRATMERTSGFEFGVAVAVGIVQLIHLILFGLRNSGSNSRAGYRRFVGPDTRESLLENGTTDEDDGGQVEGNGENGSNRSNYGTTGDGANHRLEPSGLGEEGNNWR
ncbi:putative tetraspanin tsp3 protein [Daldinia childiae]|uniref:putative tetraspanin tsp3 protein n=1 Tax=Daldinia childiae TaxID=326645 RepID=UPI001446D347|nr:putative tetraspanin tsp3 protein [Daldinia childiae]KAF3067322.1 putative tetraspanin tsp3 protein [Daldinia childiae]